MFIETSQEVDLSACKTLCQQVIGSYGIMSEIFFFLNEPEQTQLQNLNQFFYEVAVSRIQTRIRYPQPIKFLIRLNLHYRFVEVTRHREDYTIKLSGESCWWSGKPNTESEQQDRLVYEDDLCTINSLTRPDIGAFVKNPLSNFSDYSVCNFKNKYIFESGGRDKQSFKL